MKRSIIEIDENLCDGCGLCIPNCAEGALKIIDGKARMVSDLFCDGLGACLGHCPKGAIRVVEREAEPYDEWKVMERIVQGGEATIAAHLKHLEEHGQEQYLKQAREYLSLFGYAVPEANKQKQEPGPEIGAEELKPVHQWPIQLHLVNPKAPSFKGKDLLLAADCTAFVDSSFHEAKKYRRILAIGCPKLDEGQEIYLEKLIHFIDEAQIRSLTVLIMEVPCCGGLYRLAQEALRRAKRKVPLHIQVLNVEGELIYQE
ncbi:MAG: 4Fe-4S dicluster domain-containing protein [Spirochaetales bacterium]